jgi:outer membrane protein insertion porin family
MQKVLPVTIILCLSFLSVYTAKAQSDTTKPVRQTDTTKPVSQTDTTKRVTQTDTTQPNIQADTTKPTISGDQNNDLASINTSKTQKEYTIAGITITGTKFLDASLLTSISGIAVGDKVVIPGGDNFSKAIMNLWKQNLFSNVQIYYTKLTGNDLSIEINVQERPRLSKAIYRGAKKSETEELAKKAGLVAGRVITENMKMIAVENIEKYYSEKGFKGQVEVFKDLASRTGRCFEHFACSSDASF